MNTIFGIGKPDSAGCGISGERKSSTSEMQYYRLDAVINEVGAQLEEKDIYPLIKSGCEKYKSERKCWDVKAIRIEEIVAFVLFFRKLLGERNEKEDFLKHLLSEKLNSSCFPSP